MSSEQPKLKPGDVFEWEHNGRVYQMRVLSFNEKAAISKMLVEMQQDHGNFFELAEAMFSKVIANYEPSILDTIDENEVMELVQLSIANCYLSLADKKKLD